MCNAYNLRHRNEAIIDIARAMQLALTDLPEFPPRHRIGIKQRGLILRPACDGPLSWSWARWSLVPPGANQAPAYPLNNARADKLGSWPWKAVQRQRCLIPASGFWEPEKLAREKGTATLVLLQHAGRAALLHGGLVIAANGVRTNFWISCGRCEAKPMQHAKSGVLSIRQRLMVPDHSMIGICTDR